MRPSISSSARVCFTGRGRISLWPVSELVDGRSGADNIIPSRKCINTPTRVRACDMAELHLFSISDTDDGCGMKASTYFLAGCKSLIADAEVSADLSYLTARPPVNSRFSLNCRTKRGSILPSTSAGSGGADIMRAHAWSVSIRRLASVISRRSSCEAGMLSPSLENVN